MVLLELQLIQHRCGVHQCRTSPGDDALGHCCPGRRQRIFDPVLQLGELRVGRRAHLDHCDLAGQRADPFGEHVLVDPERRALQLGPQLGDPELDLLGRTGAIDDRGLVRGDANPPGPSELLDGHGLQAEAGVLAKDLTAGDRSDVLELAQPPVAEAGRLGRNALEHPVDVVVYQHAQGRTLDGLGDHDQWSWRPHDLVEQGHQLLDLGDLFAAQQDVGVVEDRFQAGGVSHQVRRKVAIVVLEALNKVDAQPNGGRLLDRDDPAVPDGVQCLREHRADGVVVIR